MMEAVCSSKTFINIYRISWVHISDDRALRIKIDFPVTVICAATHDKILNCEQCALVFFCISGQFLLLLSMMWDVAHNLGP
jgi:hypothetical protein